MLPTLSIVLLAVLFAGAGLFNAVGTAATRRDFVRWGYPAWWCRVTGAAELVTALLLAVPAARPAGLVLGALILLAALLAVLRHRGFAHLAPIGLFAVLLVLTRIPA
ncbi:MAG: DoxX family protein [Gluconacetobacter diazotrophicus]|nr:DoxX family protein [Gluconacetobacter diazotrophicus]